MKKIRTILPSIKKPLVEVAPQSSKMNLINAIYYDTDWWQRKIALEWWTRNGHFNEELYRNILLAKLDSINQIQN
jgi:hypothetical protein